jgi:DNA polymerase III delta prime subunit
MLPWDKKFLDGIGSIQPKTILCGPDGQNINDISRSLIKKLISETDGRDYSDSKLENIASPNFYFLKRDPEKSIIPISELRKPRDFLTLSTSNRRLLFIQGGEDIRIDGYNSLLKVAEDTGKDTYIFISTNNLSQIPSTIKSRFHITRVPRPSAPEVKEYLSSKSFNLSEDALNFLSENPNEFDRSIDEISTKMEKYDSYVKNKNIQSKDKGEISAFTDYLIFLEKSRVVSNSKQSLIHLEKLIDIKKSINLPNNLSLDVIKLRLNSCLELV